MTDVIDGLLERISEMEQQLARELGTRARRLRYRVVGSRVIFSRAQRRLHRRLKTGLGAWLARTRPQSLLSIPFIYGMALPLLLLDLTISLYQCVSFPLYGIALVHRGDYFVLDRRLLGYLNAIEKVHCTYCSYANGLLAYAREITARTEQYWCPIKHARPVPGAHDRYRRFLDYGDPTDFQARSEALRGDLADERARARAARAIPGRVGKNVSRR